MFLSSTLSITGSIYSSTSLNKIGKPYLMASSSCFRKSGSLKVTTWKIFLKEMSINGRHSEKTRSINRRNNDKHPADDKKSKTFGIIIIFLFCSLVYIRGYYMASRRYEISLGVKIRRFFDHTPENLLTNIILRLLANIMSITISLPTFAKRVK